MKILIAIGVIIIGAVIGCACEIAEIGITPPTYWLLGALTGMLAIGTIYGGY